MHSAFATQRLVIYEFSVCFDSYSLPNDKQNKKLGSK